MSQSLPVPLVHRPGHLRAASRHLAARPDRLFGPTLFYGWIVVLAALLVLTVDFIALLSFGAYVGALEAEFGADRARVTLVFTITATFCCLVSVASGPLVNRLGPRRLFLIGAGAYGLGLASRADALWQVYLAFGLGVGTAVGVTQVPALATAQRWFVRRRGLAVGLVSAGSGVGALVGPPLSAWLIAAADWRTAYLLTGLGGGALLALAGWLCLRAPAQIGLAPDGAGAAAGRGQAVLPADGAPAALTAGRAVRTPMFAWLFLARSLAAVPGFVVAVHLIPAARDAGLDLPTATLGLGAFGIGSTIGRPSAPRLAAGGSGRATPRRSRS